MAAVICLWTVIFGPFGEASTPGQVRAILLAALLTVIAITPWSHRESHTILTWAGFGASLGFAILGLFGIGLLALIPLVAMIAYGILEFAALDERLVLVGGLISVLSMFAMLPF